MKIALIGYGKMGRIIEQMASAESIEVVSTIDPKSEGAKFKEITSEAVGGADVCLDFSQPDATVENVTRLASYGKNVTLGVTGWEGEIDKIKSIVKEKNIGLVYAGNFSIGMNLFYEIVNYSSKLFNRFAQYDVSGLEIHHNKKADSPSGTAKVLAGLLLKNMDSKNRAIFNLANQPVNPDELIFSSIRCGQLPGEHRIYFDSFPDTVELTHRARNREGFAAGALLAAKWITGKKGFYSFNGVLKNIINEEI